MNLFLRSLIGVTGMFLATTAIASAGELTPVSQQRSIGGDSNAIGPPKSTQDLQEVVAPGFSLFDETLSTMATNDGALANTDVHHKSTVDPCNLTASGGFISNALSTPPAVMAYSVGMSSYRVTFDLTEETSCRIVGTLEADASTHSRVMLQQGANALVNLLAADETIAVATQHHLPPGQYIVTFQSVGTAFVQGRGESVKSGSFDMRLSVCFDPADLNLDEAVDVLDLVTMLGAWGPCQGSPNDCLADLNTDGVVDLFDLLALLSAWT